MGYHEEGRTPPPVDLTNLFNLLNETSKRVEAEVKSSEWKDAFLKAYDENPEVFRRFLIGVGVAANGLVARRMMRRGLVAAGVDPKAAKAISLGLIWGAYAIASSAVTAARYATWISDNTLYPETDEVESE